MLGAAAGFDFFTSPIRAMARFKDLLKGEIASAIMPDRQFPGPRPIRRSSCAGDRPGRAAARFFPLCRRWRKPDIRRLRTSHGIGFFVPVKTPAHDRRQAQQPLSRRPCAPTRSRPAWQSGRRARRDRHGRFRSADRIRIRPVEGDRAGNGVRPDRLNGRWQSAFICGGNMSRPGIRPRSRAVASHHCGDLCGGEAQSRRGPRRRGEIGGRTRPAGVRR